jgi:outer membrane protein OmpA-like peptidoglycan-associated protein
MFGQRIVLKRGAKDQAEKPFWISYADMMTALMVLFLVVMAVALLSIPKQVLQEKDLRAKHEQAITNFMEKLKVDAEKFPGVTVDVKHRLVNYGPRAYFALNSAKLNSSQEAAVRAFTPVILDAADTNLGRQLLKRVLVEGYTDQTGTYLHNLNLSLQRSEGVLCALMRSDVPSALTSAEQREVLGLFVVGGYSFNDIQSSPEASRRVEMQLQFFGYGEKPERREVAVAPDIGHCEV